MTKFYIYYDETDEITGCCFTLREAKQKAREIGGTQIEFLDIAVTAENMRRMLGNMGQYAKEIKFIDLRGEENE